MATECAQPAPPRKGLNGPERARMLPKNPIIDTPLTTALLGVNTNA